MDEPWNDALAIRQQQVMRCPLILDVLFNNFNAKDFLQVRSVCTLFNEYTIEMCRRKSIYFHVYMSWKNPVDNVRRSREIDNCLSSLPEDKIPKTILSVAKFTFDWRRPARNRNRIIMNNVDTEDLSDDVFFLAKYGYMIKNIQIDLHNIDEMLKIFRLCQNLETVDIEHYSNQSWILDDNFMLVPPPALDLSIVNRLTNETMILEHLHTFKLVSNLHWEFGPFLKLTCPHLRNIHFGDQTFIRDAHVNTTYFLGQFDSLNTGELHSISYTTYLLIDTPAVLDKLMELDLSSLRCIKFDGYLGSLGTELECMKYLGLLQKIATTLRSLYLRGGYNYDGIPFMDEYIFPELPKVIDATIHHSIINTPGFFQKLPVLKELHLRSSCEDVRLEDADDRPEGLLCGFFRENISMWNEGSGWTPHGTLKYLNIRISSENFMIPLTIGKMFPNLIKIDVHAIGKEALGQLQNLLNQVNDWPRLKTFSMYIGEISKWFLYTTFILIGIPRIHWDAAYGKVINRTSIELAEFITESSLAKLPQSATVSVQYYDDLARGIPIWRTFAQVMLDKFCSDNSMITFHDIYDNDE